MAESNKRRPFGTERPYFNIPVRTMDFFRHVGMTQGLAASAVPVLVLNMVAAGKINIDLLLDMNQERNDKARKP